MSQPALFYFPPPETFAMDANIPMDIKEQFKNLDTDGDGSIQPKEFDSDLE